MAAFDKLSANEDFQTAIGKLYIELGQLEEWTSAEFFMKIFVQKVLATFDTLEKLEFSSELKAALKQARTDVNDSAKEWKENRAYACNLLVSLTLRKLVKKKLLKLEIKTGASYIS